MMLAPQPKTGTEQRPLDWFKPDARELARHDDPDVIRRRGQDMLANGQLQPVGATEDGRMIFGHGRLLAARSAGIKTLEVKIYPASLTETQFRLIRAAENFHRTDLTAYQKWIIGTELMCANPNWKLLDLAEHLHLDPSSVTRLMSPSKCIPAWQEALKAGKVGISDCYAASKLSESEQVSLLALKLSGASRDTIERAGRKVRAVTTAAHAVKLTRVRCPLSTGTTVTVTGPEMTLEDLITALSTALDAARKASKESLDVKTAEKVWKDKARVKE